MEKLAVIIPVYNEEEIIEKVINKLAFELETLKIDYKIFVYNDGSTDNSQLLLEKIAQNNKNIFVKNKPNAGHGQTILKGYKETVNDYDWIFQIDADNEMDPEYFKKLWQKRDEYDFLIAIREGRVQSLSRKIVSFFSRIFTIMFWGKSIWDVNCPFRLMKSTTFIHLFKQLPEFTYSPNLIISGYIAKKKIKFYETKIPCKQRETGVISLQKTKLIKTAFFSLWQTIWFSFLINK